MAPVDQQTVWLSFTFYRAEDESLVREFFDAYPRDYSQFFKSKNYAVSIHSPCGLDDISDPFLEKLLDSFKSASFSEPMPLPVVDNSSVADLEALRDLPLEESWQRLEHKAGTCEFYDINLNKPSWYDCPVGCGANEFNLANIELINSEKLCSYSRIYTGYAEDYNGPEDGPTRVWFSFFEKGKQPTVFNSGAAPMQVVETKSHTVLVFSPCDPFTLSSECTRWSCGGGTYDPVSKLEPVKKAIEALKKN
jgi:hypothetical protein